MYLIFDTETTGLPKRFDAPISDLDNWPRCIQIAWQLHDRMGNLIEHKDFIIKPDGFNIPYESEQIHGISTDLAEAEGFPISEVFPQFVEAIEKSSFIVGQNIQFDINIMGSELYRYQVESQILDKKVLDTCTETTALLCQIPGGRGGKFKLPTLTELHQHLFGIPFNEAHNATADVEATTRCFFELIRIKQGFTLEELDEGPDFHSEFAKANPEPIKLIGLKHLNLKKASKKIRDRLVKESGSSWGQKASAEDLERLKGSTFVHLHNHTQFSVLQATTSVQALIDQAIEFDMPAVAMTDTANLMGAFNFVQSVHKHNQKEDVKPLKAIVGCEFFVCENHLDKSNKDNGYKVIFIAKNKAGYQNLAKLSSIAYTKGFYYVPRIDKEVIKQYKENLIVLSGGLQGEVPNKLLNVGEKQAEEALIWWKSEFADDFYIELMRHHQEDEERVMEGLVKLANQHEVKLIATNNTYYINKSDANAHDILLCVKDGEKQATPIGRGRGFRYGLSNQEYYFKNAEEMKALFEDLPQAIWNIEALLEKIEPFTLSSDILLPKFDIPQAYQVEDDPDGKKGENNYLRYLTYEGAKKRYDEITDDIKERLDFELDVIANTGYPGYFLIVQDFIAAARDMNVSVGPGRGSAAGSAVAYCLWITNIDPIAYDLLFERFLNPDRVSMPDIDIDFDDEGRGRVIDWVIDKYGAKQVAQIITYGTMAAKSAIRDTARVLDLPLPDADHIAKLIPGMKLKKIFKLSDADLKAKLRSEELVNVNQLKELSLGSDMRSETINQAKVIEGSVRNTGIHACGVIITPDDITNFVPVSTAKDSDMYVTQFDNNVVENAGLLKMDFLGLKTLTLIKDTVKLVKHRHGLELDMDEVPLDDVKTYELFQRGQTVGVFQYESPGMQKYLRELKPTVFADLIAMNALYRPGPLEYIPSFVRRKNGEEEITYDLEACKEYLEETYGITVYQEQVMLLSQKLAGFTKGEADMLRKAMGKKIFALLEKLKPKFIDGGKNNGHDEETLEKIWKDWEAFASYAFNKSHSTCYAFIAYQTAYLKAHYPAEYMAAVLSNNMNDIKQVTFFMEECKRMGLNVLGPDVNESYYKFTVNEEGAVRFGMGGIKGVGGKAVESIIEHRDEGKYASFFDMVSRIDLRAANKKALENLILAGALDCFNATRATYFYQEMEESPIYLEKIIRYGTKIQAEKNSAQLSLFGGSDAASIEEPTLPVVEPWNTMKKLKSEKEVVGIYLSGHPLDDFKTELNFFCNGNLSAFSNLEPIVGREVIFAGIITDVQHRVSKNGKGWAIFSVEDYNDAFEFKIFGEDYLRMRFILDVNQFVYFKVMINEGWINKDTGVRGEPRIKFKSMEMLQDVLTKYAKNLSLHFDLNQINDQLIEDIQTEISNGNGKQFVQFYIHDKQDKIQLKLPSRSVKTMITKELIQLMRDKQWFFDINDVLYKRKTSA